MKRASDQRTRAERRRAERARRKKAPPVQNLLYGDPGDCSCPICLQLALSGEPVWLVDEEGNVVERGPLPIPEIMEIRVRPRGPVTRYLPAESVVQAGVGCIAGDLLGSLGFGNRALQLAYPVLRGYVRGELCESERVLLPGDVVEVEGVADPEQSALLRRLLEPMPAIGG